MTAIVQFDDGDNIDDAGARRDAFGGPTLKFTVSPSEARFDATSVILRIGATSETFAGHDLQALPFGGPSPDADPWSHVLDKIVFADAALMPLAVQPETMILSPAATVTGTGGNDFIHVAGDGLVAPVGYTDNPGATSGDDDIDISQGGTDQVFSGGGNDLITLGATLTSADHIDGGDGSDGITLDGDYSGGHALTFSNTLVNVEAIYLRAGYQYVITTDDAAVTAGHQLSVSGTFSYNLVFDASADPDGSYEVLGGGHDNQITGGGGDDAIYGQGGNDTLNGGGGNDNLYGGGGDDTLNGGSGNDTADLGAAHGSVTVSLADPNPQNIGGDDGIVTLIGIENLSGGIHDDFLTGDGGDNVLTGHEGNDTLTGGGGNDTLNGGSSVTAYIDTAVYSGAHTDYTVTANVNGYTIADQRAGAPDGTDTVAAVEQFQFTDGLFTYDALGRVATQTVVNQNGTTTVTQFDAADTAPWATVATTYAANGSILEQEIATDGGAHWYNVYDTAGANAWLWQTYYAVPIGPHLFNVSAVTTNDDGSHLVEFDDPAQQYSAWSTLYFGFDANWNQNYFNGYDDNGRPNHVAVSDTIEARDVIPWFATPYDPNIGGPALDTTLTGGSGIDVLYGFEGNDTLNGGGGNDYINGGHGNDTLTGGADDDRFVFRTGDGLDTITDFTAGDSSGDVIDLHDYGVLTFTALQAFMTQVGADTVIAFDDFNHIVLHNVAKVHLNAADFVLT